jgi:hypothetical protein
MAGESYIDGMPRRKRDKDGIFDRGDGWLYLQYKGRHALRTQDRATARKKAIDLKRRLDDPAHATAHVTTLGEACEEFRDYAETGENRKRPPSAATFQMYETHFGNLCRVMGVDLPLDRLVAETVDRYISTRRKERVGRKKPEPGQPDRRRFVEANTVDKELGTLRQILRLGLRRGWYHLPLDKVLPETSGAEYVPLTRHLTLEQVPVLLAELARPLSPGQRRGQYRGVYRHPAGRLWEAKISDSKDGSRNGSRYLGCFADPAEAARAYDAAALERFGPKAVLNFPMGDAADPAGRAAYCAYIVAYAADVVAAERAERYDLGDENSCNLLVLVRGTKNAARWEEVPTLEVFAPFSELAREYLVKHGAFPEWSNACRDLAAACKRVGLPRVTPRDLRRTHGKILAALGVDAQRIGEMMRHTTSRMAQLVYAKPERIDVRRHAARQAG